MPLLVKLDNKRMWDSPGWLPAGEVTADAVLDLRVEQNELSVWFVEQDRSNLERVLGALAANREHVEKLDYAVFDEASLAQVGVEARPSQGQLPDEHANENWHRDLVELSGRRLVAVAEVIASGSPQRCSHSNVRRILTDAAVQGHLRRDLVRERLAADLPWPQ